MFGDPSSNPNHFPQQRLFELAEITSGITKGRKTKSTDLRKVPYICTANVQDGRIDWSEVKYIEATEDEIQKYAIQDQDVLVIEGGDADKVGRGCIIQDFPAECIFQNHVFRIRVNMQLIAPKFLSAFLLLPTTKEYFLHCAKQTTGIATINKNQISQLTVMYPSLGKQKEYIAFIEQTDKSKFAAQTAASNRNLSRCLGIL